MNCRGTGESRNGIYSRSYVMRGPGSWHGAVKGRMRSREGAHVCQRPGQQGASRGRHSSAGSANGR